MSKKFSRRTFIGASGAGIAGAGMAGSNILVGSNNLKEESAKQHTQRFNMCGYRAPALETVGVGFIGLGSRGPGHVVNMSLLEGVDVKALCDVIPEEAEKVRKRIEFAGFNPTLYSGDAEAWKKMCDRDDIDLVYICTPWHLHAPMAVYAMEQGKHVAIEVPAVNTLEECWQLVETSEKTRKHCMMMENCCYDFFELLTLEYGKAGILRGTRAWGRGIFTHASGK